MHNAECSTVVSIKVSNEQGKQTLFKVLFTKYLLNYCRLQDPRVEDALGAPIKGYGEETTRRRRTHVSHAVYEKDGVKHMRMRFYIKGIRNKGVVELDMKQVSSV